MLASNAQSGLSNKMYESSAALQESAKWLRILLWSGVKAWCERLSIEPCKVYYDTCRRARHGSVCDLNLRATHSAGCLYGLDRRRRPVEGLGIGSMHGVQDELPDLEIV